MKRAIITVSVLGCMTFSAFAGTNLSDIEGHWANTFITDLTNRQIISGYPDGTFRPNSNITISEFTVLALKGGHVSIPKTDVWYQGVVDAAMTEGIILEGEFVNEYGTDKYNKSIERGEMARIVVRTLKEEESAGDTKFSDDNNIPNELKGYIKKANELGIINGYTDESFKYDGQATRAEASTMISKMLEIMENGKVSEPAEKPETLVEEEKEDKEDIVKKDGFVEPVFEVRYEETGWGSNYFSIYILNKDEYTKSGHEYKAKFVCTNYPELNTIYGRDFYGDGGWIKQDGKYWKDISEHAFWALRRVHRIEANNDSKFNVEQGMKIELTITIKDETTGKQKDYYETVVVKKVDWQ